MITYLATLAGEGAKVEAGSGFAAHFTQLVHLHIGTNKEKINNTVNRNKSHAARKHLILHTHKRYICGHVLYN